MELNLDNGWNFSSGWSDLSGTTPTGNTGESVQQGGSSFISDAWSGLSNMLSEGLNVWEDYIQIEHQAQTLSGGNNGPSTQWTETNPPVDTAAASPVVQRQEGQWIAGVSNTMVMGGGAALVLVLLLAGGRR